MSLPAVSTVLTVEDDPIVRADLRQLLERDGFSVCADARDGLEAVELARSLEPDVILLDLRLPRLDGVEATRRIREERDVPIVVLSGYWSGTLLEEAVEAGAHSYVRKPFAGPEIVRALRDALAGRTTGIAAARERSRRSLARVCELLGYPDELADELERRSFEAGRVWRLSR